MKDLTKDVDYARLVREEIEEYSNIEVTENLREGGIHAHDSWAYYFQFLESEFKTSFTQEVIDFANTRNNPKILSLGCGYGGIELSIAEKLIAPFEILGLDLNEEILLQAREVAKEKGLNVHFKSQDINFIKIDKNSYDLIVAHASLHHILNLEHLFEEIYSGLKADGRLIIQDIIGKTQVLFWKENVDYALDQLKNLPDFLKDGIEISAYREPDIQVGMEGIRQEELEGQILNLFFPIKSFHYGAFMRLFCTHSSLGKLLDPNNARVQNILHDLCVKDLSAIRNGILKPTELLGVYKKISHSPGEY